MTEYNDVMMTEVDQYLFGQGKHYEIYRRLGAHLTVKDGIPGVYFAVWAPNARFISVVGNFNHWNRDSHPMKKTGDMGIWEVFIPNLMEGEVYKYCVNNYHGVDVLKADPFGFSCEVRPENASKVASIENYEWTDQQWLEERSVKDMREEPMFIYEVHPGSWKKHPGKDINPQGFYNYREFAHSLTEYVLEMGYTHVELIGIAEHPFDGSWGYQVSNYYAPTSRHGSPKDFMYLVDYLHSHGISVILDWVPAHFPKDLHGLSEFDGTCQYEYLDSMKANHPQWGTKIFDYGKNEVQNFLISNALYWIKEYHVDGLRVDAVASMLYLDFCREPGQWTPNMYGGNSNLEAIEFIKNLNQVIHTRGDGALIIAEESTAWPKITGPIEDGGLGFDFKWNMGWMNDFLKYVKLDPIYRQYHQKLMNFSMMYAYNENYIQVLSHDEVVHMKGSMIGKMPGPIWDKVANLKTAYSYMIGHPGKKLLFMGQDFGQIREWSEEREIDWYLLSDARHSSLKYYMSQLISLYRAHPCMYELDCKEDGFTWVNADDNERSIFSFERHSKDGKDHLLFVCNFTPVNRTDYRIGAYKEKEYTLLLNSDDLKYGGGGMHPEDQIHFTSEQIEADGRDYSFHVELPAYATMIFSFDSVGEIYKERTKAEWMVKNNPNTRFCFGVDVGGTTIKMGFFSNQGELIDKWEIPTRTMDGGKYILGDIEQAVTEKLAEQKMDLSYVEGLGMGVPGPVDENGIVRKCVNLGWGIMDVAKDLSEKLKIPVKVANDANVAALGEAWKGAAEGSKNSVMVTLGTGVGGGIILNGRILSGSHGAAGEIGHICMDDREKEECNCGNRGCLEQYVSATGIVRMAKILLSKRKRNSSLRDLEELTAKAIFDAAYEGDTIAKELVKESGRILGKALASISCTIDPEKIVIGGGVSRAGEILRSSVEEGYRRYAFHASKDTEIVLAQLGNDAGIYGSVALIMLP